MKTDFQLQSEVRSEFRWQPGVNTARIGVAVKNGVVTLTGQVANYAEKTEAEFTAKSVHGVKTIANGIDVILAETSRRTDADIAAAAVRAMKWDFEALDDKIELTVRDGWVTLHGTVDWQYQKDAAGRFVCYLMGVSGVSNLIRVKPQPTATEVGRRIEHAFRSNLDIDARWIAIETFDDAVTLSGCVCSWWERDEAEWAAWAAPGVTCVDNKLVVVTQAAAPMEFRTKEPGLE